MESEPISFDWTQPYVLAAAAVVVCLLLAIVAWMAWRRKPTAVGRDVPNLSISVAKLAVGGPERGLAYVEVYGVPLRLAVLVLAPAGRGSQLPAAQNIPRVIDSLVPGLAQVFDEHAPLLRFWPAQLSTQGFASSFFTNVKLPGDHGKGTPWCSVAGKFEAYDQHYLIGLLCVAKSDNGLGEVAIQHPGQWLDIVRVKRQEAAS